MTADSVLTGPIPSEIGDLPALHDLELCEWASINRAKNDSHSVRLSHTFLVLLDSSRMTDGNTLTGLIPSEIGTLSLLYYLELCEWASVNLVKNDAHSVRLAHTFLVLLDSSRITASNALTGTIPTEIGFLTRLHRLLLREWPSIYHVKNDSHSVRMSHTLLVLLDSSRLTDVNELTDPMPTEEIESLPLRECYLSKSIGEMSIAS
jgi:predicted protein tyrosine phosphatase